MMRLWHSKTAGISMLWRYADESLEITDKFTIDRESRFTYLKAAAIKSVLPSPISPLNYMLESKAV